jgi:hypothetical protein
VQAYGLSGTYCQDGEIQVTIPQTCTSISDGETGSSIQNFCEETSLIASAWNTEKIEDNSKMYLSEINCKSGCSWLILCPVAFLVLLMLNVLILLPENWLIRILRSLFLPIEYRDCYIQMYSQNGSVMKYKTRSYIFSRVLQNKKKHDLKGMSVSLYLWSGIRA